MDAFLHVAGQGMIFAGGSPGARVEAGFRFASLPESGPRFAAVNDLGRITPG